MQYPPSELVLNKLGAVYHLGLKPENIAQKIILVGDQDRVALISAKFERVDFMHHHREFTCHTGSFEGKQISVISTGIGTDNIDIVLNELDALVNIDLENRCDKSHFSSLEIIRIGTCGILQAEIPVGSYILSSHAFGLDNIPHFYQIDFSSEEEKLNAELMEHIQFPAKIQPYLVQSSPEMVEKLKSSKTFQGITTTSSGFYGPQGRNLRLHLATNQLNDHLESFRDGELKILNFEMESSALFVLSKALGHRATSICLGIANRPKAEFMKSYEAEMDDLISYVLNRI